MTPLAALHAVAAPVALLALLPLTIAAQPLGLDAYVQLRRSLESAPDAAARADLQQRAATAREVLLAAARGSSRLLITVDHRGGHETVPLLETARLVARDGKITLQALGGPHPRSPRWERIGLVQEAAYLAALDRLLHDAALLDDWPAPRFDPNAPGPRRAVTVSLTIGEDERQMQAVDGPGYERLAAIADDLLRFCRTVPLGPLR